MKGRIAFRRQTHADRVVYIVYVLWMIGHSQRAIASVLSLRKTQVAGIIDNSQFRDRAGMTAEQIAENLADLAAIRLGDDGKPVDGGKLDRVEFKARPLDARQARGPLKRRIGRV